MVKYDVTCVRCEERFDLDTEDPSEEVEIIRGEDDASQVYIKTCPFCGKSNRLILK